MRVEKSTLYLPFVPLGSDPWLWENLLPEWGDWPYPSWDPTAGDFDIPGLPQGLAGPVQVRVRLMGFSEDQHRFTARLNGQPVGELVFEGKTNATLVGTVLAETLLATGNQLSLSYSASTLATGEPNPLGVRLPRRARAGRADPRAAGPGERPVRLGLRPGPAELRRHAVPDRDPRALRRSGREASRR